MNANGVLGNASRNFYVYWTEMVDNRIEKPVLLIQTFKWIFHN